MMKSVLEVITLRSDQTMAKGSTEVFSELQNVKELHCPGIMRDFWRIQIHIHSRALSSKPPRHNIGIHEKQVCCNAADRVVEDGIAPFDQGITSFHSLFGVGEFFMIDIVLLTKRVENVVNFIINELS